MIEDRGDALGFEGGQDGEAVVAHGIWIPFIPAKPGTLFCG